MDCRALAAKSLHYGKYPDSMLVKRKAVAIERRSPWPVKIGMVGIRPFTPSITSRP